jgi:GTPase
MKVNPVVTIVGRPNVGKSALFNRLFGSRKALVSKISGLTRDRNYGEVHFGDKVYTLVDTGGLEPQTQDEMLKEVQRQTELAIYASDIVLFLVDVKDGVTVLDKEIANILRKIKKKVILVANKVDNEKTEADIHEFYQLGMGEPLGVSSIHGLNIDKLMEKLEEHIPVLEKASSNEDLVKIALIGKPNVGKSSLVNALLNEERVIVNDKPGTTRDAIDTLFERDGKKFILIDTAGIRHKGSSRGDLELLSLLSAQRSIERADLALIVLDGAGEFGEQDEKIAGLAYEAGCASIIVVNKWDLIAKDSLHTDKLYLNEIRRKLKFLDFAPVIFTSAKTKHGLGKIIPWVSKVITNYTREIHPVDLRDVLDEALANYQNPLYKGRAVKISSMEQVAKKPPTFKLIVSDRRGVHFSYRRYLENKLRDKFDFTGTPVRFVMKTGGTPQE